MRLPSLALPCLALAVLLGTFLSRTRRPPPVVVPEEAVAAPTPSPAPSVAPEPAPSRPDVRAVLDRAFQRAVEPLAPPAPAFVTGDFTGDGVTDLAVPVRPRGPGALATLQEDQPRFRVQDATALQGHSEAPLQAGDRLLAVVHGLPGVPWTADADRPAYLVRHAVGARMRAVPLAGTPASLRMRVARAHAGDVIALDRGGRPGLIVWTGATYTWEDGPVSAGGGSGLP
jgi:hypothetical protein